MKTKLFLLVLPVAIFCSGLHAQTKAQPDNQKTASTAEKSPVKANLNGPVATWDKTVADFGEIPFNVPKSAEFILTNDGNEPLIISSATASCGCTNLKYDKEPVLPKKSTVISATYNAAVKGNFIKTITVRTNAGEQPVVLQIKGVVVEK